MKQPFSVLVSRFQSANPHKSYSECCSILAKRKRKVVAKMVIKNNEMWWNKD